MAAAGQATKRGSTGARSVERILSDYKSTNVDLQSFTREFVGQLGGAAQLAKLLAVEIQTAPVGSVAKANLLGKALDLVKLAEGGGAADLVGKLSDEDAQAVMNKLLDEG